MHFRHFMIMGVLAGAAALLPNSVFAEKSGPAEQAQPQNSAVQAYVSEKVENAKAVEKTTPVTPAPVNESQGGAVRKPVTNPGSGQMVPVKPDPQPQGTADRGNSRPHSASNENSVKAGIGAVPDAKEKPPGQEKANPAPAQIPESPAVNSLQPADSGQETNQQSPSLHTASKAFGKDSKSPIPNNTDRSQTLVQKPPTGGENNPPADNKKAPEPVQILNNPPQRTQSSGGQSDDQSSGPGTINFDIKWFNWDDYFGLNLSQIYISRMAKYCNQWMNAPPSPPPKDAPFFYNV